jgi:Uma2 family endonuclease
VVEILSPGPRNRRRDLVTKRDQYAARGMPEYWLIDPETQTITLLQLQAGTYAETGQFGNRGVLLSPLLPNLNLTLADIFQIT